MMGTLQVMSLLVLKARPAKVEVDAGLSLAPKQSMLESLAPKPSTQTTLMGKHRPEIQADPSSTRRPRV